MPCIANTVNKINSKLYMQVSGLSLNVATVVKIKIKNFGMENRHLPTSALFQMHKSDTVYKNKHHHRLDKRTTSY